MCGIAGIFHCGTIKPVEPALLTELLSRPMDALVGVPEPR